MGEQWIFESKLGKLNMYVPCTVKMEIVTTIFSPKDIITFVPYAQCQTMFATICLFLRYFKMIKLFSKKVKYTCVILNLQVQCDQGCPPPMALLSL
jgi:hypothetical protein